jgi:hypothetical protein
MQSSEFRLQNEDAEDRELKRTRSAEVPQGGTAKFLLMLCRVYTVLPLFVLSSRSPERVFLRGSQIPFLRTRFSRKKQTTLHSNGSRVNLSCRLLISSLRVLFPRLAEVVR